MPLAELASYIDEHRHLPGVPTATEVAEHGVDLGAGQAQLLAKIEELTLYLLDLARENQTLTARLTDLEKGTGHGEPR